MKKTTINNCFRKRKLYAAPRIFSEFIALEGEIALGSAQVTPPQGAGEIQEEWEIGKDRDEILEW